MAKRATLNSQLCLLNLSLCAAQTQFTEAPDSCRFRWIYEWYVSKAFSIHKSVGVQFDSQSVFFFFFALTFFVVYIPVCHQVMESACQAEWNNPNWMDWRQEKHVLLCNLVQAHMYGCKHTHWKH